MTHLSGKTLPTCWITSASGDSWNSPSPTKCDRTSPKYSAVVPACSRGVLHIWWWINVAESNTYMNIILNNTKNPEHKVQKCPPPRITFIFTLISGYKPESVVTGAPHDSLLCDPFGFCLTCVQNIWPARRVCFYRATHQKQLLYTHTTRWPNHFPTIQWEADTEKASL